MDTRPKLDDSETTLLSEEEIAGTKIHVCTPSYDGTVGVDYLQGILDASLDERFSNFNLSFISDSSWVAKSRNQLLSIFMSNVGSTHILFIDSDIGFSPEDIGKLISCNKYIISGCYPKRTYPVQYPFLLMDQKNSDPEANILECAGLPGGFLLIKREAIEILKDAYPELKLKNTGPDNKVNEEYYGFFSTFVDKNTQEHHSEDYSFCVRWRKLGGKLWIHSEVDLSHSGKLKYSSKFKEVLKLARGKEINK